MKAFTLHQPWASLVALGVKTIETRSWPAPARLIGQPLAIHAAAKAPHPATVVSGGPGDAWHLIGEPPNLWMRAEPPLGRGSEARRDVQLPLGAVVATCRLAACVPMVHTTQPRNGHCLVVSPGHMTLHGGPLKPGRDVTDQLPYGDFRPGRFAWLLEDVKPTTERCPACWGIGWQVRPGTFPNPACFVCEGAGHCPPGPAKGRQRVWNWQP